MKCRSIIFLLILFSIGNLYGIEAIGKTHMEIWQQGLNLLSPYNMDNMHQINAQEIYLRGNLTVKSDIGFGNVGTGVLKLQGQYRPMIFTPDHYELGFAERDKFFIKELYVNVKTDFLSLRAGKQYIHWGQSAFFNPIDVMNPERDLLTPAEEREGNPFISITVPIGETMAAELLTRITSDETIDINFLKLPIIPRFAYNSKNFNFSVFSMFQYVGDDDPQTEEQAFRTILGLSFGYSFAIGKNFTTTLFSEFTFKTHSDMKKVTSDLSIVPYSDPFYIGFLFGGRCKLSTPTLDFLDGIDLVAEYYYDGESWGEFDLKNYQSLLDAIREEGLIVKHWEALSLKEDFRSSKAYCYGQLMINSLILTDLKPGVEIIMNLTDFSFMVIPQISYPFKDSNLLVGCKAPIFMGKESESLELPAVDERSEYGSEIMDYRFVLYFDIFL